MAAAGVIDDGCVAIAGNRIVAVGPTRELRPASIEVDFDGLLTPGLVNAHTHLDLTLVPRPPRPKSFQDWLLTTMSAQRGGSGDGPARAVHAGIEQCLKFGVTCVGDISQNVDVVRSALHHSPLRGTSYGECLGIGGRRVRFDELLAQAVGSEHRNERLQLGVSPHAPYTVEPQDFTRAIDAAKSMGGRVTTHFAETPDEAEFLEHRRGPFSEMYRTLGFDPCGGTGHGGWENLLSELLRSGVLLAHMNYLGRDKVRQVGRAGGRIVWCPRTHAYFGHAPHPWRELAAAGATVCIGTDSCASAGDLNLINDLRLVRTQAHDLPAEYLWTLVTTVAARAMSGELNSPAQPTASLVAGDYADLVAWPHILGGSVG